MLDAVIFDMDGVVTDTADAHAAAWKRLFDDFLEDRAARAGAPLEPFDERADYRAYVDGKPRYEGVRSFLGSRGIALPYGDPDDPPDAETVCGLGNRKNDYFRAWLADNRVRTYPTTVRLVERLKGAGVGVGLFTSSRNGAAVLRNAGLSDLFDTRVDGNDLAELDIPGKPDPAMLMEAARRLGAAPARTAVVEDAMAGVEAGAAGGFATVVGVDRGDYGDALAAHGADLVVHDLGELDFDPDAGLSIRTLLGLPRALDRGDELRERLAGARPAVFLDYDGTLTPIVEDHTKAFLGDDMRDTVDALARRCAVAVISGRDLRDLERLVGLDSVLYAGSHGFDIELPGKLRETLEKGEAFLPDLDAAEGELKQRLAGIEGHAVERKRFAIAVHYRRAAEADVGGIEQVVDEVLKRYPGLRKSRGKKVFHVQPRADWDKGRAVRWMLAQQDLDRAGVMPIYMGDDLTDEDAFRSLAGHGIGIAVADGDRPTSAAYQVAGPDEVQSLLRLLIDLADGDDRQ